MPALARHENAEFRLRPGGTADLEALVELESRVFATDRVSRRGFRRFLASRQAALIVAEDKGKLAGYALVLFRPRSALARLYSIAVAPQKVGRGLGSALLAAAEEAAIARDCSSIRLEVHERNNAAIARYEKAGYRLFGRHRDYYGDHGAALRYHKRLHPQLRGLAFPPPYFRQTTEFTCGAACLMMALAAVKPSWKPEPATEFKLWRDATTIFTGGGPGGCDPFGLALTLKRQGLAPEIHVNNPGPYFLHTVDSEEKRRVMQLAQEAFRKEARKLAIPTHLTSGCESALLESLRAGGVAIVLVSGYHLVRRRVPHWVFAFGFEGRHVLMHDPSAKRDEHGLSRATYAVPASEFERMMRVGRDNLRAAILIRKGPQP